MVPLSNTASVELIQRITEQLNTSLELTEVLGKVLRLTVEATKAARGSLFLLDEQGEVTHHILARPNQPPHISASNVRIAMTEGLAAWVYQQQQGAVVVDTATDERWIVLPGDTDVTSSVLGVPLIYRGRVNGILTLHHEAVNFFHKRHLTLATGIAGQAAVAIENASLFTQVKQERESLYALMRGLPIPVLVVAEGQLIFRNQAAERELQIQQVDIPLTTLTGGLSLQSVLEELSRSKNQQSSEVTWPDGRIFNISINEVSQHGTVIALSDVTHLKALAALKTQFVETVSHDLRNPISLVKGFARLLEFENLSEQGRINLEQISHSATHMEALIKNLLDLAQIEAGVGGQVKSCDMTEIVQTVLDEYKLQISAKEMTLIRILPVGLGNVLGDPVRLAEVVANLVSNALKYTPKQGRIMVSLARKGAEIHFQVTDTGRGVPAEARSRLFQKFYRVPIKDDANWVEGTGLGLSIVKAIVEDYGGRVWVESEADVGSTFGCALPVAGGGP